MGREHHSRDRHRRSRSRSRERQEAERSERRSHRRYSRSRSRDRNPSRKHMKEKKEKKRDKKHHKHSKKTKEADELLEMEAMRKLVKENADDMLLPMDFGSVVSDREKTRLAREKGYGGERDPRDKAFSTAFGMTGMSSSTTGFVAERHKPDTKVRPPKRGDKPGPQDWVCPKCQTINFKQATDCFKCGRLRGSANSGFFQTPSA